MTVGGTTWAILDDADERDPGATRRSGKSVRADLPAAEMPQIDQCVGQGFERIMQRADALEAQQQAAEFIFPGEHALNGAKALL
jgi:hypothetical protein